MVALCFYLWPRVIQFLSPQRVQISLARLINIDPAVVSALFVTTVGDATGLLVYLLIAGAILNL